MHEQKDRRTVEKAKVVHGNGRKQRMTDVLLLVHQEGADLFVASTTQHLKGLSKIVFTLVTMYADNIYWRTGFAKHILDDDVAGPDGNKLLRIRH